MPQIISTIEQLSKVVKINKSTPYAVFEPFIASATDIYLKRYLGAELIQKLQEESVADAYKDVLDLVRKSLGPMALWIGNAELSVRVGDSGFTVEKKTDSLLPASDTKIAKVEESLERRAFQYLDMVLEYLEQHAGDIAEWSESPYNAGYIRSAKEFQELGLVDIGYSRLAFENLRPLMGMVTERYVIEYIGEELNSALLQDMAEHTEDPQKKLISVIRKFVACKTAELYTSQASKKNRTSVEYIEYKPIIRPAYEDPDETGNFFANQAKYYLGKIQEIVTSNAEALGIVPKNEAIEFNNEDRNLFHMMG